MDYFTYQKNKKPVSRSSDMTLNTSTANNGSANALYIHDSGKSPSRPTCILYPSSIFTPEEEKETEIPMDNRDLFSMAQLSTSLPSPPILSQLNSKRLSASSTTPLPSSNDNSNKRMLSLNKRRFSTPPHTLCFPRIHVLIVDDNPINLQILSKLLSIHLSDIINQVELVKSGVKALEVLKCRPFDLILMDIDMPIMNGIETTLHIRSSIEFDILPRNRKAPIVAVTTNDSPSWRHTYTESGMNGCIGKPISPVEMKRTLLAVLDLPLPIPPFTPE
ncbi:CheY-like superfamily [Cokeromyces recurvatus]|uniref:CheY-like superfamily n=1 Tax=Cokeromyces recurvatus TaxID=90255 RepID=UPI0022211F0F|nr:CheY-like superfamily [Cokeromyces recurvatus]KAI7906012.1 CheY-like superfamily [Cokeromyces recurvatus]